MWTKENWTFWNWSFFENDDVTITTWFPYPRNPKWPVIVTFSNPSGVVNVRFRVKPPFSNSSRVVWKASKTHILQRYPFNFPFFFACGRENYIRPTSHPCQNNTVASSTNPSVFPFARVHFSTQWATFDIFKFSLIERPSEHKQTKWICLCPVNLAVMLKI